MLKISLPSGDVPAPRRVNLQEVYLPVRETYVKMAEPYGRDVLETLVKELDEAEKKIAK
jgi:hypothetical protein